jgi:hypothetical protein
MGACLAVSAYVMVDRERSVGARTLGVYATLWRRPRGQNVQAPQSIKRPEGALDCDGPAVTTFTLSETEVPVA